MDLNLLLVSILAVVIGGLVLTEMSAWAPKISEWLTSVAAGRMAPGIRSRYREEWAAYLSDMPTGVSKLCASAGFIWSAETMRLGTGVRAFRALADYLRIRRRMRPYIDEAKSLGGSAVAIRLVMQPCGNRHLALTALFPLAASPFIDEYNETVRQENAAENLDLTQERVAITDRARRAISVAPTGHGSTRMSLDRMTNHIFWPDRDPRAIRTLLILLWKARRRRIRRRFDRVRPRG
jgi:hypothetical protein